MLSLIGSGFAEYACDCLFKAFIAMVGRLVRNKMRNKKKTAKSVCWLLLENEPIKFEEQNEEQNEDINNIRVTRLEKQKKTAALQRKATAFQNPA